MKNPNLNAAVTVRPKAEFFITLLAVIVLGIAPLFSWGTAGEAVTTGLQGDGKITLGIAIIILILAFIRKIPVWITLILAAIAFTIGVMDFVSMYKVISKFDGNVGLGIYLTILASFVIVVNSVVQIVRARKI